MVNSVNNLKSKVREILALAATPQKVAIGAGIAVFWNFIPSLGVGPILTFIATRILKGHVVAALTLNIGTSFFIPLFYTLNIITGSVITGGSEIGQQGRKGAEEYTEKFGNFSVERLNELFQTPELAMDMVQDLSMDFVIGSVINSFVAGLFLYFVFLYILKKRQLLKNNN